LRLGKLGRSMLRPYKGQGKRTGLKTRRYNGKGDRIPGFTGAGRRRPLQGNNRARHVVPLQRNEEHRDYDWE